MSTRLWSRLGTVALGLAVAGAGLATVTTGAAGAAPSAATSAAATYRPPPLRWQGCDDATLQAFGAECADLVVPLDYSRPNGRTITLAVSRVEHQSSDADYQGVMLVNPGGPGGSGLIFSVFGDGGFVPGDGDITYDWIGFDPRGVGDSEPALTCDPDFFGYDRPPYEPRTGTILFSWLRLSRGYAQDCRTSAPGRAGLLRHVRTTDNVADMESLRKALGERKMNLYGFSYGTYLGQVYATQHPRRVRRFVWDGVVNPGRVWYRANLDQNLAFQKTMRVYFGWLADHDDLYGLGSTTRHVARGFYAERRRLDRRAAGGVIGGDELTDVLLSAGYYVGGWIEIAEAYSALVNDGDYAGIAEQYPAPEPGSDNGNAIYLATVCTDAPWPSNLLRVLQDNRRVDRKAPFETWGNGWFNGPCNFWPVQGQRRARVSGKQVRSPMLLVSETKDAATPYSGALAVRRRFPTSSLIEGVGGTTHAGSLSGIACTDDAIGRYLTDGTVPRRRPGNRSDLRCPPVPQPEPSASDQRQSRSAARGLPDWLRERLVAQQVR